MPSVSPHMKALNVEVLHCLYLHARNSRKHNASDGYAAAIWLVVVRKVCEQDAYRQYRVKHQQPRTWGMAADSDDRAHVFRSDAAQRSDLIARR